MKIETYKYSHRLKQVIRSLLLVFAFCIYSCNETKEVGPEILDYEFYPIKIGQYRIYDIEEINYLVTGAETSVYQLKETIFEAIQSLDQTTYLVRRDTRSDAKSDWKSNAILSVVHTKNHLAITAENIPLIKLIFPVTIGSKWDGNSLNSKSSATYYYQEIEKKIVDTLSLDKHIRIIIADEKEDVIGVDLRSEVYAKGIGLVEKRYLTQTKCTSSDCGANIGAVVGGYLLKQTIIEIGNEK